MESTANFSESSKEIRFIESFKGNKLIVFDGYMYQVSKTVKKSTYFKCSRKVSSGCTATITLYNYNKVTCKYSDKIVSSRPHNHVPNPDKIAKHEVITTAKTIVKDNVHLTTATVVDQVSNEFIKTPQDAAIIGKVSLLKRNIRNARRKTTGERYIGTSCKDFVLPNELQLTIARAESDAKQFLLKDIPGKNRTLVFGTAEMLQILAEDCKVWMVDGTFKLAPEWFSQVFTVHGVYMGTQIPMVYSVLPGKKKSTYKAVFDAVISSGARGGFNPEFILSDFEIGIIRACKMVFPHVKLYGCHFHLTQSIYRKVNTLGLTDLYKNNKTFRNAVRSLGSLSFVPPGDVFMRFMEVKSWYGHSIEARKVIDYFYANYIGDDWNVTNFPISFWNCFDRFTEKVPRTNNAIEGWHYKMNSLLTGAHPSVWACIEKIQREQKFWEEEIYRDIELGQV